MTSDGKTTKRKVVDLDDMYNFVGDNFFIRNSLCSQICIWGSKILKFNFFKQPRMEKSTKTKVVDLDEDYNFVVDEFFIWNHLRSQKYG
jgi:hypothetical protein